ncbi:MAG: LysM peptidoglycan-binding domain-containing protein [Ignavibacteriota bacterium]
MAHASAGIGETVADVGKRYGIAVNALVAANSLESREASEGDRLIVPTAPRIEPAPVKRTVKSGTSTVHHMTSASGATAKSKAPAAHSNSKPKPKTASKTPVIAASAKPRRSN